MVGTSRACRGGNEHKSPKCMLALNTGLGIQKKLSFLRGLQLHNPSLRSDWLFLSTHLSSVILQLLD